MKIQIISDIHLEFYENPKSCEYLKPKARILCIVGDLCCIDDAKKIKLFFDKIHSMFKLIMWVPGNHEYYVSKCPDKYNTVYYIDLRNNKICSKYDNIKYLKNKRIEYLYNNTLYRFIGSTLWSYIPPKLGKDVENLMSDYSNIYLWNSRTKIARKITYKDVNLWHKKNIKFINNEINNSRKLKQHISKNIQNQKKKYSNIKTIILTHHKPFIDKDSDRSSESCAYESDQTNIMKRSHVNAWVYGHTHKYYKGKIGDCLLASNPRGYPYQPTGFKNGGCINV